jgi:hypothetical protein
MSRPAENGAKLQTIQSGGTCMRNKRLFTILTVLTLVGLLAWLTPSVYAATGYQPSTPSLVGTWKMTIPTTGSSPELTEGLQTYFADGNFIETNNNSLAGSTAHGVWIGSGNTYLNTFQVFTFDEQGKYNGKRTIHALITLDGPDHYIAQFVTDQIDVDGTVTKNIFAGNFEGARMEAEFPKLELE